MPVVLPQALVASVQRGTAVLFLGAGASKGAVHPDKRPIPEGDRLRDLISDRFLGGQLKSRALAAVADFAISETSLIDLQTFLKDTFIKYEPAEFHKLITEFHWHALATTNYDLLVERVYEACGTACAQHLVPFVKNGQHVETEMKLHANGVQFLKLHGSIDHYTDLEIPLIISTDQYAKFLDNRVRLFRRLEDWGEEFSLVFVGYSVADPNIRGILHRLFDKGHNRPRYYIVSPSMEDIEVRYWEGNRVTHVAATFEEFLVELKAKTPAAQVLNPNIGGGTSTLRSFYSVANAPESNALLSFLADDVDHVRADMPIQGGTPAAFYKGYDDGWFSIAANLDVHRSVTDALVVDAVLEEGEGGEAKLYVLKGPGGNGKTVCLKRAAWMAATDYGKPVLVLRRQGAVRAELIEELFSYIRQRIYMVIDQAGSHADEIEELLVYARAKNLPLTILTAEREAEWNVRCDNLEPLVTKDYPVRYLSEREVRQLLVKLEEHKTLGLLAEMPREEQVRQFMEVAERQLLVALHQVTLGKPFERIVLEEYHRIIPNSAQRLYLDICTLNRFGVGVRAGLISRVSDIRFIDFQSAFFRPLEHLVEAKYDKYVGDYVYRARHRRVAEMVFQQVLTDPERRYDQLIYILDGINIDYSSDNEAFGELIRGRAIAETFPSVELGRRLFDRAERVAGEEPFVLQQRAIFEMEHRGGSLVTADRLIRSALATQPYNKSLRHTQANVLRRQALETGDPLLRDTLRNRAKSSLREAVRRGDAHPHSFNTLARIALDELKDIVDSNAAGTSNEERAIVDASRELEDVLSDGMQRFPFDEYLLTIEAEYREFFDQHEKAEKALETAFNRNPRLDWVAARLCNSYLEGGRVDDARSVLKKVLQDNPSSTRAHFSAAKFYMKHGSSEERARVVEHLRRSFKIGDTNYEAQFWFARELFMGKEYAEAQRLFNTTKKARYIGGMRNQIRGIVVDCEGQTINYRGRISRLEEAFAFVKCPEFPQPIYVQRSDVAEGDWAVLSRDRAVSFSLGFTFSGPIVASLSPE